MASSTVTIATCDSRPAASSNSSLRRPGRTGRAQKSTCSSTTLASTRPLPSNDYQGLRVQGRELAPVVGPGHALSARGVRPVIEPDGDRSGDERLGAVHGIMAPPRRVPLLDRWHGGDVV